jgi:hypothetical protein
MVHRAEVHPTGGSLRVFKRFRRLRVDSAKMALSRPAHQRVTRAVSHPAELEFLNIFLLE